MLQNLQTVIDLINNNNSLSQEEKTQMIASLKEADKKFSITEFKLDRTEKVKRTTAILLEETIEELEQKRKAVEAQNRELEIENALEKVRAIALSMSQPADMLKVCHVISEQLALLKVDEVRNVQTAIIHEDKGTYLNYEYYIKHDKSLTTEVDYKAHDLSKVFANKMLKGAGELFIETLDKKALDEWYAYQKTTNQFVDSWLEKAESLSYYFFSLGPVALGISTYVPLTDDNINLFKRFRNVFELAYRRFLDIQKAEAQAKEAQIQLALERVRARTMAMQHSDELTNASAILDQQVRNLGIKTWGCAFHIYADNEGGDYEWFSSQEGTLPFYKTPRENFFLRFYELGKSGADFHLEEFTGEACKNHYDYLMTIPSLGDALKNVVAAGGKLPTTQYDHLAFFKYGYILFITYEPVLDADDIFKRFANVFEQTYTRFLDLQKAEAQAREAQIEAALERVRSRTLAMQKSEELAETSAVLFKQLILLGISPNRLYISIIKDDVGNAEFWITDEDGGKVSMAYEDNLNTNVAFKKMYAGWKQQKKSLIIDMQGEELEAYFQHLSSIHVPFKGGLKQKRRLQHIAYFSKGFIGMASPDEQPKETIDLLERFAYVFNHTFTRFNDLQVAEAHALQAEQDLIEIKSARQKAEAAFVELQVTQRQLIQSEKMASLGELTAGIAHEIQNPLNFVNNFSETNSELLEEAKTEFKSGNTEEGFALLNDIQENEKKINHHGRRADSIVKGMLEHSRTSKGEKQPTNLNALIDEYLRLAYHGIRAKDKAFNADIQTHFDESIGKVNIVPQEIGRVLLNLFNNAFYAVGEKKLRLNGTFEPTITVSTGTHNGSIILKVSDNGTGIPQKVFDKIFQPFFTTKPTGQGTGLGLSLSYDIIKAHNGELKVESKEGEGSEFTIILPA